MFVSWRAEQAPEESRPRGCPRKGSAQMQLQEQAPDGGSKIIPDPPSITAPIVGEVF